MVIISLSKYIRMSSKKIRDITKLIQGHSAKEAINILHYIPRKSAKVITKTLYSAIANAENNCKICPNKLIVKRAVAENGPCFRRLRPVSKGIGHSYRKHTTHIRIILSTKWDKRYIRKYLD